MTDTLGYQRFFAELKRRRVFRVMAVYGIVGFVLLQLVDLAVPALLLPEWTYRLVALFLLLGFPVAIVLAWALEMTPEGVRRTTEATPGELTEIITAPASKHWPAVVLALVGVTALLAGAWYVGRQSAPAVDSDSAAEVSVASIAVLPFVNMSSDPEQEYFSDGISEELLNLLAKIPELQVAARTSSFSYKGKDVKVADVARELNVAHVLEGSVRKSGNEVRVTAQLIKADDGFHMWSETWNRSLDDIFAIQDEIAADVVEQLQVTLLGATPKAQPIDPEAYTMYLQARQLADQFTAQSLEQSNERYRQALEMDPGYAAAWAGLAVNYANQVAYGLGPLDESYTLAREAAGRALAIDPEFAPAHASLGMIAMYYDADLPAVARHYRRALELDPTNPDILAAAADLYDYLGRLDKAIEIWDYLIARDPVNPILQTSRAFTLIRAGRFDEALVSARTGLSLSSGQVGGYYVVGQALLRQGKPELALAETLKESHNGYRWIALAIIYAELGRLGESDAAVDSVIATDETGWAYNLAYVYALRNEADTAFKWLDTAVEYHDAGLAELGTSGNFENIKDDPRWLPYLESIGNSPEQLAAIEFEVRLPQ